MDRKTNLFKSLDFFMLRTPILPVEFFNIICFTNEKSIKFSNDLYNNIISISRNPAIREAIEIASPSLLKGIDKIKDEKDIKKKEQTVINFTKYLIRMSTRPTPFGLFSGITSGEISDMTNIALYSASNFKKNTRPDMEWLLSIIHKIETNKDYVRQLEISTNTLADYSGERAYLSYNTQYGKNTDEKPMLSVSVRFTEAVKFAFERAQHPVLYSFLLKQLFIKYPEEKKEVIENFVWQLFETEFFISELRPPLMIKSPFDYVLNKLSRIKGFETELNQLGEIKKLIEKYDKTALGNGKDIYIDIVNKMEKIHKSKNYLQVDLLTVKKECILNKNIVNEMEKVAECLWRLSPEYTSSPELTDYRNDFIEKYGIYREIPILELLDPDRGLGAPAGYLFPESRRRINNYTPMAVTNLQRYIQSEIVRHKFDKDQYEIEITDEILSKIEPIPPNYSKAPISMELFFSINSFSETDIDNGNYELILAPNPGSTGAGKTFGRFIHFLDNECKDKLVKINELEKAFFEEAVFAEIVYMPESGRTANICISENYRDFEIVLSTNSSRPKGHTLLLSDLLIGTTFEHFYIKSKSLGKRVIITTGHMLNLNGVPNIYRFLREISYDGTRNWSPLLKGSVNELPFIPRIKYRKTIISPAVWNLSWESIGEKNDSIKNNPKEFILKIIKWKNKWNVPRYVYLTEMDNRILLDLDSNFHLRILLSETTKLNRYSALSLVEARKGDWVKANGIGYASEFVVPFVKNKNLTKSNDDQNYDERFVLNKSSSFADDIRLKYPGSDWLFLKFYGNSNREEEFIAFTLKDICKEIVDNNLADKYFFMRYLDPDAHIRLRFNGNPSILTTQLLPRLYDYTMELKKEGLLSRLVIDTYEREVERYGGPEIIDFAEDIFHYDSQIVEELIFLKRNNELELDFEMLIVVSIIDYLESFGLSYLEQLEFLETLVNHTEYLSDYRKSRTVYLKITNSNDDWQGLKEYKDGQIVKNILIKRHSIVKRFIQKLYLLENKGRLFNSKNDILASIIHLHCNRIIGIDRVYERKLMTLARHSLHNLKYFKKSK